ncbi:MAG: PSD1 and planctomycete cytochrome C domain-containing protein [Acidobacteriota bacterium]
MPGRFLVCVLLLASCTRAADSTFFETKIRPLLAANCYACHGPDKQFGSLRLDSRDRILRGGAHGPAAVASKPAESLLIKAVRHDGLKMPVGGKLKPEEIAALEQWVQLGLPWPEDKGIKLAAGDPAFYAQILREHWAFQPLKNVAIPDGPAANPIDRFISSKLRSSNLDMAPGAEKHILARRAAFVLTGLPLSSEDLHTFLNDASTSAYERLVDRLMASPQFGERWARHWMDLVRYAETYGYEWNYEIHGAWRYRDYLIRAFNSDLPYDQFVREHIAGDLLPHPRTRENGRWNESVLATAFYRLGEMGHDNCNQFPEIRTDVVDNQIDTLTKSFQGLTVSCARCHDHKIDPIPTEDYYALYGILNSSRPVTRTVDLTGPAEATREQLSALKAKIRRELASVWLRESVGLGTHLAAAISWESDVADPAPGLNRARIGQFQDLLQRKKVDMSDPLYPVIHWINNPGEDKWRELAASYVEETASRQKFNAKKFTVFADFRTALPAGWSGDGWGFRTGRATNGDFAVATEGGDAIISIVPAGVFTNLLSDRLNGVLRSPILPKDKKFITLQTAGGNLGAIRLILDGCVIGEDHQLIESRGLQWLKTSSKSDQPLPTYLELATKRDNPRLPERPEKFKDFREEQLDSPRSFWGVTRVLLHNEDVEPKAELGHMGRFLAGAPPQTAQELGARFEGVVRSALQSWSEDRATADDAVWLDWMLRNRLLGNSRNQSPELRSLTENYRKAEAGISEPAVVSSMADLDSGSDYPILRGGEARAPGRIAPRHFLTLMPASLRTVNPEHSGRLQLAEAIASGENPLTARVMVNRLWHYVFGRGLTATTDNFGRYGDAPTDPELLDYLATQFMNDGWSMKKSIRLMMLSDAFRQSSKAPAKSAAADPQNLLWSRFPIRRMEAEAVRDSILAVAGSLDLKQFGPSVQPHRDEATPYRRLFQGPLDGNSRRSIYLKITRMQGPRFLETFDFPPPMQTRGNRDVTNVPSQSLALLNDPFVTAEARAWALRLIAIGPDDAVDARLSRMFESAFAHPASPAELARLRGMVQSLAARRNVPESDILSNVDVWKDAAHTFFNMKEFVYVR